MVYNSGILVERYEDLRHNVLARQRGIADLGLALFCHRGMPAWIKAWLDCSLVKETGDRGSFRDSAVDVPPDARGDMVMMLVNMVLGSRKGAETC